MAFVKGKSGNPAGRPRGTRHKATLAIEQLLDGEAEAIGRKAIEMAKAGDTIAMRLCLERIAPPRKDRLVCFQIPPMEKAADAKAAAAAVVAGIANGELTPSEATELMRTISGFASVLETADFEAQLAALEQAVKV